MKVIGFNGSPRKNGNTSLMIKRVFSKLEAEGIQCVMIDLAGKINSGCIACMKCKENKNKKCALDNDILNECINRTTKTIDV